MFTCPVAPLPPRSSHTPAHYLAHSLPTPLTLAPSLLPRLERSLSACLHPSRPACLHTCLPPSHDPALPPHLAHIPGHGKLFHVHLIFTQSIFRLKKSTATFDSFFLFSFPSFWGPSSHASSHLSALQRISSLYNARRVKSSPVSAVYSPLLPKLIGR